MELSTAEFKRRNGLPDWEAFDEDMLAFFKGRLVAGSTTPLEDTEAEFGEDATWCIAASVK